MSTHRILTPWRFWGPAPSDSHIRLCINHPMDAVSVVPYLPDISGPYISGSLSRSIRWITANSYGYHNCQSLIRTSAEEAMIDYDALLRKQGYILCNTEEEVEKWLLLQ
jgi:hypothetical protein